LEFDVQFLLILPFLPVEKGMFTHILEYPWHFVQFFKKCKNFSSLFMKYMYNKEWMYIKNF